MWPHRSRPRQRGGALHWTPRTPVTPMHTTTAYPSILEMFRGHVALRPDAPAVAFQRRRLTYGELDALSTRIARWILARLPAGAGARPLVPLCLTKGPEQVAALLAILKIGGAYV